jgi:parallel beta-helix repeat protein
VNENTSNKIAISILLGTILSALLLALSETSNAAAPIAINSCTDITTSGNYKLIADLTSSSNCISIRASNVDLRLNGHTITGPATNTRWWGILVDAQTNVNIKGPGVITNFAFGVILDGTDSSEVTDVTATHNFHGFAVVRDFLNPDDLNNFAEENSFKRNTASGNVSRGFFLDGAINNSFLNNVASNNEVGFHLGVGMGNHVKGNTINENSLLGLRTVPPTSTGGTSTAHTIENNTANGNRLFGILLDNGSTGNNVNGNTAQGASFFDLADNNSGCDNNIWTNNVFNTANATCIQ